MSTEHNMNVLWRTLGFAVPTVALVTALHLAEMATVGEAIDGVVSGLWFVAMFLLGTWLRLRLGPPGGTEVGRRATNELLVGVAAAVFTWVFLWLFWNVPPSNGVRRATAWIFPFNSAIVFAMGLLVGSFARRREPEGAH
jgi:hypothetical protein